MKKTLILLSAVMLFGLATCEGSFIDPGTLEMLGGTNGLGGISGPQKWTAVADGKFDSSYINAIAYGNNRFVAVGGDGKIAYSANGETWSAVADSKFPAELSYTLGDEVYTFPYSINGIAYGGGRFVAGGDFGKMAYSANGETWTAVADSKFDSSHIYGIAYGNNRFVAVGYLGKMAYSVDGENWTAVTDSTVWEYPYSLGDDDETFTLMIDADIKAITYGNNRFVAVGEQGKMAYSADGVNWTAVADSKFPATYTSYDYELSYNINAIAYGNNRFVAVGDNGKMAYSSDGENWTVVANSTVWKHIYSDGSSTPSDISGIVYGNGRFVAVGDNGKMAYSANGASWTAVANSTFGDTINGIAYGNVGNAGGRFVAVGSSGKMAYANW